MIMTKLVNRMSTRSISALALQIALTGLAIAAVFKPWLRDWTAPFNYEGDTIFNLILIKSIANSGWTWFLPDLSAPMAGFNAIAFPQNISLSWSMMKVISLFTKEPGQILNFFWLGSIVLTSLSCHIALRILKLPYWLALPLATLYALLPYALMRNTAHISLTFMFVPIIGAYAIAIMSGLSLAKSDANHGVYFWPPLLWASCVAIGLDYIYTAYFSCFFLVTAAFLASLDQRSSVPFKRIVAPLCIMIGFTLVNLAPTIWIWMQEGVPPNMGYKSYSDVETYGLKIRHLLSSPALLELVPAMGKLQFPLENENKSAMLGALGSLGFVAAILYGLVGRSMDSRLLWSAGVLTIAGTLLGTIGGFGAMLSFLLGPDIRAYNRVSPFLAFFSFFVLGHLIFWLQGKIKRKLAPLQIAPRFINGAFIIALTALFVGALIDQSYAVKPLLHRYASDHRQAQEERLFIQAIEDRFPQLTHFYQLPETPFPVDAGTQKMGPYDHGRPYLWSRQLKWSWPNFSIQGQMWLHQIGGMGSDSFLQNLADSGFNAIWLDRNGFDPASLSQIEGQLLTALGKPLIRSQYDRYAVYGLAPLIRPMKADTNQTPLFNPIGINYAKGFYPKELTGKDKLPHYWSKKSAELKFYNFSDTNKSIVFQALLSYNTGGTLRIQINSRTHTIELKPGQTPLTIPLELTPHSKVSVKLQYDGPAVEAPNDPRQMYLSFSNPLISVVK
jgi:phosphoglycerol transferase